MPVWKNRRRENAQNERRANRLHLNEPSPLTYHARFNDGSSASRDKFRVYLTAVCCKDFIFSSILVNVEVLWN